METRVRLSPSEIFLAALAGVMRQVENIKDKRKGAYGADEEEKDWQMHIQGCIGEYVLAKFLGVHWEGKGKFRHPDVGTMQVRTGAEDHYRLILHPEDADNEVFWLVCGKNGDYDVKGWIRGREGKLQRYWQAPKGKRPAFFVPQHALHKSDYLEEVPV